MNNRKSILDHENDDLRREIEDLRKECTDLRLLIVRLVSGNAAFFESQKDIIDSKIKLSE